MTDEDVTVSLLSKKVLHCIKSFLKLLAEIDRVISVFKRKGGDKPYRGQLIQREVGSRFVQTIVV